MSETQVEKLIKLFNAMIDFRKPTVIPDPRDFPRIVQLYVSIKGRTADEKC